MTNRLLAAGAALALLAVPFAAQAQNAGGSAAGAAAGATTGAIVGGPVGAVVGGIAGATLGGLAAPQATQVQQYVVTQRRPSVRVTERVVVGEPLPQQVELYAIPADVGVQTQYRYSIVNDQTVLVDPSTRRVVQVLQ